MRLLDGEFSALSEYTVRFAGQFLGDVDILTDNTLSREVFPAFWSPIMVTSISVALSSQSAAFDSIGQPSRQFIPSADRTERVTATDEDPESRAMASAYQKVLSNQSYTLRKRPAIMPTVFNKVRVVSKWENTGR